MANKTSYYVNQGNGYQEVIAGTTGGSGDANKLVAFDQNGMLPLAGMPVELTPNIDTFKATEDIAPGAFVTLVTTVTNGVATTTIKNATTSNIATRAFAHAPKSIANGTVGQVFFLPDKNVAVNLDPNKLGDQWLSSTTPGATTNVAPTGAGVLLQYVGYATSPTTIHTVNYPVTLLAQ